MALQAAIWRDLAKQTAAAALRLSDPQLRVLMLTIAERYEMMAERAELTSEEARKLTRNSPILPVAGNES